MSLGIWLLDESLALSAPTQYGDRPVYGAWQTRMYIEAQTVLPLPAWALRQRHLVATMNEAAQVYRQRYTRPDGSFVWRDEWPGMDGSDDGYESYGNWPLFYVLGGSAAIHEQSRFLWDAVTRQFTAYGQIHREFDGYYDWMHHGESSLFLYYLGLADPAREPDRARALRFARMYTGEDDRSRNWDPDLKQMRSPINGSRGPRFETSAMDWQTHREILHQYPVPYLDLAVPLRREPWGNGEFVSKADWNDDQIFNRILAAMNKRMMRGDVPLNLTATSLITHAYALTGDERYKSWTLDYLEKWAGLLERHGGICPDNIGPSGQVGECLAGKWWGGYYGWSWPHGFATIIEPLTIAAMNAVLLTGDLRYLDIPRRQIDAIWELGREEGGMWLVPHRHTDEGWVSFRPFDPKHLLQIWCLSHASQDLERIERLPEYPGRWQVLAPGSGKGDDLHSGPWLRYLQGKNPQYPDLILENQWLEALRRMDAIRTDTGDPEDWDIHHWQNVNPVRTEALLQTTCGGPQVIYHGGLLHTKLRYFDPSGGRPGLPPDVGALVETMDIGQVTLRLCNTSLLQERRLLVQGGAFGEHRLVRAETLGTESQGTQDIQGRALGVSLPPGRSLHLALHLDQYCFRPSYSQPL